MISTLTLSPSSQILHLPIGKACCWSWRTHAPWRPRPDAGGRGHTARPWRSGRRVRGHHACARAGETLLAGQTDGQIFHPRVEKKRVGNLHPRQTACPLLAQACSQPSKRLCLARQAVLFQLAMQISEQANLVASKRRTGPGGRPPEIPLALACQALIHGIQQDTEDTRLQGWGRAVNLASACA